VPAEWQAGIGVEVVYHRLAQLRIVPHLDGVHAQPHNLLERQILRQVRTPAAHQVENPALRREQRAVELSRRCDGVFVDMHDQPRLAVELLVDCLIDALEMLRLKGKLAHACSVPQPPVADAPFTVSIASSLIAPSRIRNARTTGWSGCCSETST